MNEEDKLRLRVNQPYISQNVELSDIIDTLISEGIVDDDFYHRLNNKFVNPTPKDSMTNLLFELPKKGPRAYIVFYTSLEENYDHVRKKLNETDLDAARSKFNAAQDRREERVKNDLHNLLRTTASLLETLQSGMDIMNQPSQLHPVPRQVPETNQSESTDAASFDKSNNSNSNDSQDHTDSEPNRSDGTDVPDYTEPEPTSPTMIFSFDDEVTKHNIIKRVNVLSECSRYLDRILTVVTNYIKILQGSYEERKLQTMFFAEAVQAICTEVQYKLHELDQNSRKIVAQAEDIMTWQSDKMLENQDQIDDLFTQIDSAERDVVRAAKLVKPVAAEAIRNKEPPSKGGLSCMVS